MRPDVMPARSRGFALPAAIFLLVVLATLAAFLVQITAASQVGASQDLQGARAYQAARLGVETALYAIHGPSGTCAGGTLASVSGLTGFKVTWACTAWAFNEGGSARTIYQITTTACTTTGAGCPSTTSAELASSDYTERQLVVVTER